MYVRWMLVLLALSCGVCMAQTATMPALDVHVRVSPAVTTGIESKTEYPTIQMALDHHPLPGRTATRHGRVYIHIAPGTYHERLVVTQNHPYVTLLGMGKGPGDVVISNDLDATQAGGTFVSQTVEVNGSDFMADNLTIENTSRSDAPAVALALRSDRSVIKRCRILGKHHTLFADYGRQYYLDTFIAGDAHYVFGNGTAVFDHSEFHSVAAGTITSQSRLAPDDASGYVVLDSKVTAAAAPGSQASPRNIQLGDPWRSYSRTVFIRTELPAEIAPERWNDRGDPANRATASYGEAGNYGPGLRGGVWTPWVHHLSADEVRRYMPEAFLAGADHWDAKRQAAQLP